MAVKNGNTYVETSMSTEGINLAAKVIYIKSTETTYLIIDNWKKYTKLPAELMGDSEGLDIQITQTESDGTNGNVPALIANIPIKEVKHNSQFGWSRK